MCSRPRAAVLLSLGLLCFSGCQSRDPLDWKVSAATPADLVEWQETVLQKLPSDLKREVILALNNLAATLPNQGAYHHPAEINNPLCMQINRLSVRGLIREGYYASSHYLQERVSLTTEQLTKNITSVNDSALDEEHRQRFATVIAFQRKQLEAYKQALDEIAEKTKRFTAPAS